MTLPSRRTGFPASGLLLLLTVVACGGDAAPGEEAAATPGAGDAPAPEGAPQAAAAPDTDIWIATLERVEGGLALGPASNATDRAGYDNQPVFLDDATVLYTAEVDGDTDIWRLSLPDGGSSALTRTSPESEYSATPLPTGDGISVIRVEADSTQRLWRVGMDGVPVEPLFPSVMPVGYHAWADAETALLFVLGSPATLHRATLGEEGTEVLAEDIGRSINTLPGGGAVSYVRRLGPDSTEIRRWTLATGEDVRLIEGVEGGEDHTWTPDGFLLQAHEHRLYAWHPAGEGGWELMGTLDPGRTISRLAVSPDGSRLALVVEGPGTP